MQRAIAAELPRTDNWLFRVASRVKTDAPSAADWIATFACRGRGHGGGNARRSPLLLETEGAKTSPLWQRGKDVFPVNDYAVRRNRIAFWIEIQTSWAMRS
jgi:hypothetical protein